MWSARVALPCQNIAAGTGRSTLTAAPHQDAAVLPHLVVVDYPDLTVESPGRLHVEHQQSGTKEEEIDRPTELQPKITKLVEEEVYATNAKKKTTARIISG